MTPARTENDQTSLGTQGLVKFSQQEKRSQCRSGPHRHARTKSDAATEKADKPQGLQHHDPRGDPRAEAPEAKVPPKGEEGAQIQVVESTPQPDIGLHTVVNTR